MATEAQGFAWETAATHQSVDLTEAECWTLLASQGTGRVAYQDNGRVLVFPVNYVVHDRAVYFRTAREGVLGGGLDYRNASFQIDEHDALRMDGWSVLLSGRASAVDDSELLTILWGRRMAEPWGGGQRDVFIGIEPALVTGRRVGMR
ncbi:pyridoxamine 5'-phosphate oxidase family protein [Arthrobacter sp. G119Y2]|uniref:pyridoxamine 5'-phosphate oxidase family protein n=1 Tax=Arthrobacter sp. G119Y2 TaxID=3134965 RepID=UPI003119953C